MAGVLNTVTSQTQKIESNPKVIITRKIHAPNYFVNEHATLWGGGVVFEEKVCKNGEPPMPKFSHTLSIS